MKSDTGVMREAPTENGNSSCRTALLMQKFSKGWEESAESLSRARTARLLLLPGVYRDCSILEVTGNIYSVQKGA